MELYEPLFIYIFLPLFMGIYSVIPSGKRKWVTCLANALFLASCGVEGLIGFAVIFLIAYFSAIPIYNLRNNENRRRTRRLIFAANVVLNVLYFVFFAHSKSVWTAAVLSSLSLSEVFGAAFLPLHAVSYLVDVYRGDSEAQTSIVSLFSYMGFFPSLSSGLILKYKSFKRSFSSPTVTHEKLAVGIRCYVGGLSVYSIIAERLCDTASVISAMEKSGISGAAVWYCALIYYLAFMTRLVGCLLMGQGIALMMGIPVRRSVNVGFLCTSFRRKITGMNSPLSSWVKDYVYKPISGGKHSGVRAVLAIPAAIFIGAMQYRFDTVLLPAALLAAVLVICENAISKMKTKPPAPLRYFAAKVSVIAVASVIIAPSLSGVSLMGTSSAELRNETLYYLLEISYLPLALGLLTVSGIASKIISSVSAPWLRVAMPAVELVLMIFCTAFVIVG